jgi:hypothetical protein
MDLKSVFQLNSDEKYQTFKEWVLTNQKPEFVSGSKTIYPLRTVYLYCIEESKTISNALHIDPQSITETREEMAFAAAYNFLSRWIKLKLVVLVNLDTSFYLT